MLDFAALFAFCDLHASRWPSRRQTDFNRLAGAERLPLYYDRHGFPIPGDVRESVLAWARLHADRTYSVLAHDELPDGSRLSTVWLGLDHGHGYGHPLFFETMRLPADSAAALEFPDPIDGEETTQLRYGSEEEALAAHHEILRRLRVRLGH
jgi:hypothetical protein